jgi:hypothetical protein
MGQVGDDPAGVALIGSLVLLPRSPAHASIWLYADNFENDPGATWWFEHGAGTSVGEFTRNDGFANSGLYYADMQQIDQGWISVDHTVHLPVSLTKRCQARAFFMALPPEQQARVNIEIINPSNWTYIALGSFTLFPPYPIFEEKSISWIGGPSNVIIRLVVLGDGVWTKVKVDDVRILCTY